ncbi:MAG: hypothetical protein ACR2PS_07995 [Pseudomonadales bacterium]
MNLGGTERIGKAGMDSCRSLDGPYGVFHGLTVAGGFQDLSAESRSVHVLRHDVAGLTIYANTGQGNEREMWRNRRAYVLAYESELGPHDELQQVILESDQSVAVFQLLELVNAHAERIQRDIESLAEIETIDQRNAGYTTLSNTLDLQRISGFTDPTLRESIQQALARLSDKFFDEAYEGFTNAVLSKVDDWLMTQSLNDGGRKEETIV